MLTSASSATSARAPAKTQRPPGKSTIGNRSGTMTYASHAFGLWPRLMRAATAAAYVDEPSVEAFRRKVGSIYPRPIIGKGSRQKWDREE